ncbi:TetR family transcriptional regulator [Actinomadura graeca]|uniref:TetR family transcriptional regulator n=1 Tax=Actinomadura graeca TaxID=2750812 RepID=A0ABX8QLX1_9ACTN|nr:TetR family transcriptional regulator [Actinomadura graeca]QXJ19664.1 TetR family transcriptional regulator [Actinomadura graeca]
MARPRTTSDEAVLAAAARALGRVGPVRLTLGAVAEEAGLAPATLVQRFGSKRGLLLALAGRGARDARLPFERARHEGGPPLVVLHAALASMTAGVRGAEEMANNLGFLQLDVTDPEFRAHAASHARAVEEEVAALLREAVAAGELGAGADAARLARSVQVAYNGALILWAVRAEGDLVDALRADVEAVLAPHRA